jgi:hypothetical protein
MICNARACHVQYASDGKTSRAKIRYATASNPATSRPPYPCPEREGKHHQAVSGMNRKVCRRRLGESWEDTDEMQYAAHMIQECDREPN